MANDTYTANADGSCFVGRFSNTPFTDFADAMIGNTSAQYTGTNVNSLLDGPNEQLAAFETDPARDMFNWSNKGCWDNAQKKARVNGTSEGYVSTPTTNYRTKCVIFNAKTDLFSVQYAPTMIDGNLGNGGHVYDANASRLLNGYFYRLDYNNANVHRQNASTDVWETAFANPAKTFPSSEVTALDVFPDMGASGSVILFDKNGRLFARDISAGTTTEITKVSPNNAHVNGICFYVKALRKVCFGGGSDTGLPENTDWFLLDEFGTVEQITGFTAPIAEISTESVTKFVPCPNDTAKAYLFDGATGNVYEYDFTDNAFTFMHTMTGINLSQSVCIPIFGHGAIACWYSRVRSNGTPVSEFWLYKVA